MEIEHKLAQLGVSLAIGLLIGVERGWHDRELGEGRRVAGLRTFGLIGLAGGLCAVVGAETSWWLLPAALLGLMALMATAFMRQSAQTGSVGVTTLVAGLVTFLLGALPVLGMTALAAGSAVVTALLLGMKPRLHAMLRKLEESDLMAVLRLLLISVVVLPVLPDRGFGPGEAVNPFEIWWMVVLIATISFAGYVAVKVLGPARGVGLTALLGGLVSSTAVTVSLSRLSGRHAGLAYGLGGGVLLASTAMFLRLTVIVSIIAPALLGPLAAPVAAMTAAGMLGALWLMRRANAEMQQVPPPRNPLQLHLALGFGVVLAAVMLVSRLMSDRFGETGLYAVSAISGLADVDAVTLSAGRLAADGLAARVAAQAIVIAVLVNTAAKAVIFLVLGGKGRALVIGPFLCMLGAGVAAMILT